MRLKVVIHRVLQGNGGCHSDVERIADAEQGDAHELIAEFRDLRRESARFIPHNYCQRELPAHLPDCSGTLPEGEAIDPVSLGSGSYQSLPRVFKAVGLPFFGSYGAQKVSGFLGSGGGKDDFFYPEALRYSEDASDVQRLVQRTADQPNGCPGKRGVFLTKPGVFGGEFRSLKDFLEFPQGFLGSLSGHRG